MVAFVASNEKSVNIQRTSASYRSLRCSCWISTGCFWSSAVVRRCRRWRTGGHVTTHSAVTWPIRRHRRRAQPVTDDVMTSGRLQPVSQLAVMNPSYHCRHSADRQAMRARSRNKKIAQAERPFPETCHTSNATTM